MNFFCEMADIQNYLLIEYKDEYQKSKWTIECRIFISFIWSRSELWNRKNNNVFTKKTKIGMTRFRRLYLKMTRTINIYMMVIHQFWMFFFTKCILFSLKSGNIRREEIFDTQNFMGFQNKQNSLRGPFHSHFNEFWSVRYRIPLIVCKFWLDWFLI